MPLPPSPPVTDALGLALRALGAYLAAQVPELVGRIRPAGADLSDDGEPPWLAIRPTGVKLETWLAPAEEVDTAQAKSIAGAGGQITVCVGEYAGPVELVLSVNQPAARAAFQAAILSAFMGTGDDDNFDDDRHGVVVLPLGTARPAGGDNTTAYPATCSFALEDGAAEWDEEKAFIADRRVTLALQVSAPLLVNRRVPGTMEELLISTTPDMESPASSAPLTTVQVAEDGTLTKV